MTSVFISYAYQDRAIAQRLAHNLQEQGVRVWFDQQEILAGDSIVERIEEGIRQSDYLLVLISKNSATSKWVHFEQFGRSSDPRTLRVIPLRLDNVEIPPHFKSIRYLDIGANYEVAFVELLQRFKRDEAEQTSVEEIIDVPKFAQELGAEKKVSKGAEFFVATTLSVLTLIVTFVTAFPAFQGVLGNKARVYYTLARHQLAVPPGMDQNEIRKILEEKGVADSTVQVTLINKGDARANEIKVGTDVSGKVAYVKTDPLAESNPVWVKVAVDPIKENARASRVSIAELVPERQVAVFVGFHSQGNDFKCDVVCDGALATKVTDLDAVPSWSFFQAIKRPLVVLGVGLGISILGGIIVAMWKNPRLRKHSISVIDAVFPLAGRILRAFEQ